jgi:hypothetical protein
MQKLRAIELLGGNVSDAAFAVGVTSAAISQWPDVLPPRLVDRVIAALARKKLPELAELATKETAALAGQEGAGHV